MNARVQGRAAAGYAAALLAILALPPVRHALEVTMSAQMLLQLPLLVVVGMLAARALPARAAAAIGAWNDRGIAGLVLLSFGAMFWMLPRALDASVASPLMGAAKHLTVPFLVGLPLALSWPRMGFVVKGVFLLELVATAFRLGWLYLLWPERLCSLYLLADQQRLGKALLYIGAALVAAIAYQLLWGHVKIGDVHRTPDQHDGHGLAERGVR